MPKVHFAHYIIVFPTPILIVFRLLLANEKPVSLQSFVFKGVRAKVAFNADFFKRLPQLNYESLLSELQKSGFVLEIRRVGK